MNKLKFKKILKISGISILISFVSAFILFIVYIIISSHIFGYSDVKIPKNTYKYYFKKEIENGITQLRQIERKNDLMSCYDYNNKQILIIWEYNDEDVSANMHYHFMNFNELAYIKGDGVMYSVHYTYNNPGFRIHFSDWMYFDSGIYCKFFTKDEIVISNTKANKFYSLNYFSDHITVGSSKKRSELILETDCVTKTNLVILNRKGKLVFIFAYTKYGAEPIKDDFLLDILKPSLLKEGLH